MQNKSKPVYRVLPAVKPSEVPTWARRPPKWKQLIETVLQSEKGKTLPIEFDDPTVASHARSSVRDTISREAGKVAVATRIVTDGDKSTVYFTMLLDEDDKPKPKA